MGVTTISFYRFVGLWPRFWAFTHMQLAKGPLSRVPGIGFHRTLGTGSGEGFDLWPNFGVYAILATWPSEAHARAQLADAPIFGRYRAMSAESWTLYLGATRSRGAWREAQPFLPRAPRPARAAGAPVVVLTRATIRPRSLWRFWTSVRPVSLATCGEDGLAFTVGLGEVPALHLMTLSVWRDEDALVSFAYRKGPHRAAIKSARTQGWFQEDLFARFEVLAAEGEWNGARPPVPSSLTAAA